MTDPRMNDPSAENTTEEVLRAAAKLTSGVTVITTAVEDKIYGTTVAAVVPLSESPPMILACMNRQSSTHAAVLESGQFVVNVLAEEQGWMARQFAGKGDKFVGVELRKCALTGAPLLDGSIATLSCRLSSTAEGGSHTILIGEALNARLVGGRPLTYFQGSFGRWDRLREHDTYDSVRLLVLRREVPVGHPLDVADLAKRVDAREDDVHNALIRLSSEELVQSTSDGGFAPAPIGFDLVESIYEARTNIEVGVVANSTGRLREDQLRQLEGIVERMEELRNADSPDPGEFLSLHTELHSAIIKSSGSDQLAESYRRLSIAWVWRSVWESMDWRRYLEPRHLDRMVVALRASDSPAAIDSIQQYYQEAKELARIALEARGGTI
ncbi:flavin reductase [Nesterenkonia haasae]|uniref:flavin reductase n=1 Tax=Nesterenkonia haasae TaxID=2587813 RepID=UPI001391095A|nr:flavin reductase [Nesterenkonia haasae]NDK31947.1 FCD domain-containing protein [Nesterenkonia haasae]